MCSVCNIIFFRLNGGFRVKVVANITDLIPFTTYKFYVEMYSLETGNVGRSYDVELKLTESSEFELRLVIYRSVLGVVAEPQGCMEGGGVITSHFYENMVVLICQKCKPLIGYFLSNILFCKLITKN